MAVYEIPLCVRCIDVGIKSKFKKAEYINVNGNGVFLSYDEEKHLDADFIKHIKPTIKKSSLFVSGGRYIDAFIDVFINCKGMIIGGSSPYSKATWIDPKKAIIEFPPCFMMHKRGYGVFVCGKPLPCGNGEFGQCVVTDYMFRDECTLLSFQEEINSNYGKYLKSAEEVVFKNVKYKLIKPGHVYMEFPKIQFIKEGHILIKNLPQIQLVD